MNKPLVLITETLDAQAATWLEQYAQVVWCGHQSKDLLMKHLAQADALVVRTYTQVNEELLSHAPRLKVIARAGVGLDNIDLHAAQQRNIPVVYTPDANTQAVVEYVLALIFDHLRPRVNLSAATDAVAFHELRKTAVGRQLDELTVGILGGGRIGTRLARSLHALGVKVLVNDLLPPEVLRGRCDFPLQIVDKPTLFAQSDILSIHTDGRAENRHLIGAAVLGQLKPSCLLINAARGMLIDHQALADWLRMHQAQGAAAVLDVHDPEPPPAEYPVMGLSNVRLLPHLASRTEQALLNMSWVVRDVVNVLEGRKPMYPAW